MNAVDDVVDEPTERSAPEPGAARWRVSTACLALACVLAVVSVLSVWVRVQALDTGEWVEFSEELLDEEEVRESLAEYLVDELYERVDVSADLGDRLPDVLDGVARTLVSALRGPLTDGVEQIISSDRFRDAWVQINETAHGTLVAIIRDDVPPGLSTADGEVALELRELLVTVGQTLGFSGDRLESLPDDAGRIVIFESDQLDTVQQTVRLFDLLAWVSFVLVVALYAASVAVARDRRVDALRRVGLGLLGVGVFVLVLRSAAARRLVDSLVEQPSNEQLGDIVVDKATRLIVQMGWSAIIWGALIALFAWLLGDHPRAVAARRHLNPIATASPLAIAGWTALVLVGVAWWSPGRVFDGVLTALVTTALVIGGAVTLRVRLARADDDVTVGA